MLSPWTLQVVDSSNLQGLDGIPMLLASSLCPPSVSTMDDLTLYTPLKSTRSLTPVQQSLPRFSAEESAVMATFDGSIKFSERVGGFGAILWQLPEWTILWAGYGVVTDTTVNGAEYAGLLAVLSAAIRLHLTDVRVFGDSRLVIQQVLNRMRCTKPHLQTLLAEVHTLNNQLANPSFHHVKRVWNGAADHLASQGLTDRTTGEVTDSSTLDLLRALNWLPHLVHDTRFPLPEHLQYLAQPDSTAASSRSRGGVAYKPGDTPHQFLL
ncbi:hypothetical protein Ae201684_001654 [Aphanomyces euteiches]|uniref:RNase H type-1 domain-containing protein n=1 Tax=Aphanomyces euteiches TaxID=100861 RepID=A0A6G0XUB0_9STRA|nr:hypothetical protein Ae201684_001654 [Aphanomyces euteiches]